MAQRFHKGNNRCSRKREIRESTQWRQTWEPYGVIGALLGEVTLIFFIAREKSPISMNWESLDAAIVTVLIALLLFVRKVFDALRKKGFRI